MTDEEKKAADAAANAYMLAFLRWNSAEAEAAELERLKNEAFWALHGMVGPGGVDRFVDFHALLVDLHGTGPGLLEFGWMGHAEKESRPE